MKDYHGIERIARENGGILFSKELTALGIAREYLRQAEADGILERVERGVYVTQDAVVDSSFILQKKYNKAVFSHETAAYFLGYTTRDPLVFSVTVPTGYNARPLKRSRIKVYYSGKINDGDIIQATSAYLRNIACFNIEKTICDMCSARFDGDKDVALEAIKTYKNSKERNIPKLMRYANAQKVYDTVSKYMEVLF
jgi:predicted transcriptional regulator of viral defense system